MSGNPDGYGLIRPSDVSPGLRWQPLPLGPYDLSTARTEKPIWAPWFPTAIEQIRLLWQTNPTEGSESTVKFGVMRPGDTSDDDRIVSATDLGATQNTQGEGRCTWLTVNKTSDVNVLGIDAAHVPEALTLTNTSATGVCLIELYVSIPRKYEETQFDPQIPTSTTSTSTTTTSTTTTTTTSGA